MEWHSKFKGMNHRTTYKQIFCPYPEVGVSMSFCFFLFFLRELSMLVLKQRRTTYLTGLVLTRIMPKVSLGFGEIQFIYNL